jgi:hypothetical protein
MAEQIEHEAMYLRLEKLKKGLLQFTDTSNAFRLAGTRQGYSLCGRLEKMDSGRKVC